MDLLDPSREGGKAGFEKRMLKTAGKFSGSRYSGEDDDEMEPCADCNLS